MQRAKDEFGPRATEEELRAFAEDKMSGYVGRYVEKYNSFKEVYDEFDNYVSRLRDAGREQGSPLTDNEELALNSLRAKIARYEAGQIELEAFSPELAGPLSMLGKTEEITSD